MSARQVDAGEFSQKLGPGQRGQVDAALAKGQGVAIYCRWDRSHQAGDHLRD